MSCQSNHPGQFIKHCPCSPQTIACGYYNINLHTGCPYDCSYCILQLYLPSKASHFFDKLYDAEEELRAITQNTSALRIGTGELADSLADPQCDQLIPPLFKIISNFPEIVLELKTKSSRINAILKQPFQANIVIGWSLNPPQIIEREEQFTASLPDRLKAMKALLSRGYKIAIHFDPLIITADWPKQYKSLVEQICAILPVNQLAWWSLGALRFPSGLRPHIFKHTASRLFEGELIKGYDDKYRYLRPLRENLFLTLRAFIETQIGTIDPLYLCMEDEAMWQRVFPEFEPGSERINHRLYQRVIKI